MFIIRFFLFVVFLDTIIDILEIIFQVINANRYNFPVKPLLLQLLDSGVVAVLLVIFFIFVTSCVQYEPYYE
jgi:hypothetical protein